MEEEPFWELLLRYWALEKEMQEFETRFFWPTERRDDR